MKYVSVKFSDKEVKVLCGILVATEVFASMRKDESNDEEAQIKHEEYIQTLVGMQIKLKNSLRKKR